jgi:hypothetical protein
MSYSNYKYTVITMSLLKTSTLGYRKKSKFSTHQRVSLMSDFSNLQIKSMLIITLLILSSFGFINLQTVSADSNITFNNSEINNNTEIYLAAGDPTANKSATRSTQSLGKDGILECAAKIADFIEKNNRLPSYVTTGSKQIKMAQFLYLSTSFTTGETKVSILDIKEQAYTKTKFSGTLTEAQYKDMASRVKKYIKDNKKTPNYATLSASSIDYYNLVYGYSKVLRFYKKNGRYPKTVSFNLSSSSPTSSSSNTDVSSNLSDYIMETKNCQVNDPSIKQQASQLSGSTKYETANNVFQWVRDNIGYEFYYKTKYGAVGTLQNKKGNCVDTTHLLIALARSDGIPSRYASGDCRFASGNVIAHVWAQLYVSGYGWLDADATSTANTLGVINSWDTSNSTLHGSVREYQF